MGNIMMARGTANDRLKGMFVERLWGSLAIAAMLHFGVLAYWPQMSVAAPGPGAEPVDLIAMPPEVEIPPPPEKLPRPAVPVPSMDMDIDPDLTIAPTTFPDDPSEALPAPRTGTGVDVSEEPVWVPHEVRPELRNADAYLRALERRYPPLLRDAGAGGTVLLWVYVDATGAVGNTRVVSSSGKPQLDLIAEEVMREVARFRPALNRDSPVPVWVQIPVTFEAR